jgi:hypothetical protein
VVEKRIFTADYEDSADKKFPTILIVVVILIGIDCRLILLVVPGEKKTTAKAVASRISALEKKCSDLR